MKKHILAAALILTPATALAQSAQDQTDARYDRALAAGYKALFLCSAIGNAERNGATRTAESVHQLELTGIQAPLNDLVQAMPYEVVRRPSGQVAHVAVTWDDTMPPRVATYFAGSGCSALAIGVAENWSNPDRPIARPEPAVKTPDDSVNNAQMNQALGDVFNGAVGEKYGEGTRTTAVLVRRVNNDAIDWQSERYARGIDASTPQRTWSVAKSIAATLVGTAVQSGEYDVSDPIGLNYWRLGGATDPRNAITLDNMLRMASGRYTDTPGNRTDPLYWGGATVDERASQWPIVHKPGTVFRYANVDTLMAVKAVKRYIDFYTPPEFFEKVGMTHTVAETDVRGDYILSSQVWSTAPDLAQLGHLYLNNGMWNGEQLIPENWTEYVSSPSGPQPKGRGVGYGAGFWLLNASEGVPTDAFAAMGNRGQYIVIVPSRDIVIVRRGEDPVGHRFDIAGFARDVLAAVEE